MDNFRLMKLIAYLLLLMPLMFIPGAMNKADVIVYSQPTISGSTCTEDSAEGTNTGSVLSFGNGDNHTFQVLPFDCYIVATSMTTESSCGGTMTMQIDTNGIRIPATAVNHSGTAGSYAVMSPPVGPIPAGTRIRGYVTSACSSGGEGRVGCWYWIAKTPDVRIDTLIGK